MASRREVIWSLLVGVLQSRRSWAPALGRQPIVSADDPASLWARCNGFWPGNEHVFTAMAKVANHLIGMSWAFSGTSINVCELAASIRMIAHYEIIILCM